MLISNHKHPQRSALREESKSNTVVNLNNFDKKEESKSDPDLELEDHEEVHPLPSSYYQINQQVQANKNKAYRRQSIMSDSLLIKY